MYRRTFKQIAHMPRMIPIALIYVYRYTVSPLLGNCCRFYPTCSQYSQDAFKRFGLMKGLGLTVWRLLRCHPWHPGGIDPVPQKKKT